MAVKVIFLFHSARDLKDSNGFFADSKVGKCNQNEVLHYIIERRPETLFE